jgi:hypothetical protein
MTDDRSLERAARSFIESGPTQAPERAVEAALLRIETTSQERNLRVPWRITMTIPARVAAAAVIGVLAIGGTLFLIGRAGQPSVGGPGPSPTTAGSPSPSASPSPSPSASASATPARMPDGRLPAGTYAFAPFGSGPGLDSTCLPSQAVCVDPGPPTSMLVTLTVPDGWDSVQTGLWIDLNAPPGGAALVFNRGGWLYSDPCRKPDTTDPDIPVGPTVDDFVTALADHQLLDATTPVGVTVDGYAGKALDLQVPEDISQCEVYRPWQPNIYAQGPGHLWHLRVIDVDGNRVVIQSMEYAGTDSQRRAELEAMVDSIQIEP